MVSLRRVKLLVVLGIFGVGLFALYHLHLQIGSAISETLKFRVFPFNQIKPSQYRSVMNRLSKSEHIGTGTSSKSMIMKDQNKDPKQVVKIQTTSRPKLTEQLKKNEDKASNGLENRSNLAKGFGKPSAGSDNVTIKHDRNVVTQERDSNEDHKVPGLDRKKTTEQNNNNNLSVDHSSYKDSTLEITNYSKNVKIKNGSLSYSTPRGISTYTPSPSTTRNSCNLPKLNPWDPSISHLLEDVGSDPGCSSRYELSLYDVIDNQLVLKDSTSKIPHAVSLESIHRRKGSDVSHIMRKEKSPFNESSYEAYKSRKILESDFFRISYSLDDNAEKKSYYYARVVPRPDVIKKSKIIRQNNSPKKGLPLNVLMLGFESTSNANFVRKMTHTLEWLRTEMRSYVMKGYSIVGDATTPALTALLTGKHESTLPEGRLGFADSKPIDQWPWISKLYEAKGYATLHSEDDPTMGTFNLRLKGFLNPPFHHYMRPFWLAIENNGMRDEKGICSEGMSLVNYTMDYLASFFEAYKDTPKFGFGYMSYITHARPNLLSYSDKDVLYLLKKLKSRGYLNDTLLLLVADHGSRNDDVRNTMQGKLEERLPWLCISVPDWIESRHPELTAALANNEQIISSPFDLHTTLRHVLTYPEIPEAETYRSFFTYLPRDRTCREAGIDEHWCPCLQFTPTDVQSAFVNISAQAVVDHINKRLTSNTFLRNACHKISLVRIHNVMKYEPNDKVQTFDSTNQKVYNARPNFGPRTRDDSHYLITMETAPMHALFEATVAITREKKVIVNPNISRINVYGDQPKCIVKTHPHLKKFCVCRDSS